MLPFSYTAMELKALPGRGLYCSLPVYIFCSALGVSTSAGGEIGERWVSNQTGKVRHSQKHERFVINDVRFHVGLIIFLHFYSVQNQNNV